MTNVTPIDRRTPRRTVMLPGEWQITGLRGDAEIRDISGGGLFVRLLPLEPYVIPPGTRLQVRFTLPGVTVVEAWGTIRWSGHSGSSACDGFGIAFDIRQVVLDEYAAAA